MTTPTPQQILALPMRPNDAEASTVGDYLIALLTKLWQESDGFSGRYPFGNSAWEWDVYAALVDAGYANNPFDEDGYVTSNNDFDERAARRLIANAIGALTPNREKETA